MLDLDYKYSIQEQFGQSRVDFQVEYPNFGVGQIFQGYKVQRKKKMYIIGIHYIFTINMHRSIHESNPLGKIRCPNRQLEPNQSSMQTQVSKFRPEPNPNPNKPKPKFQFWPGWAMQVQVSANPSCTLGCCKLFHLRP